jgi:hypothetical protein
MPEQDYQQLWAMFRQWARDKHGHVLDPYFDNFAAYLENRKINNWASYQAMVLSSEGHEDLINDN